MAHVSVPSGEVTKIRLDLDDLEKRGSEKKISLIGEAPKDRQRLLSLIPRTVRKTSVEKID